MKKSLELLELLNSIQIDIGKKDLQQKDIAKKIKFGKQVSPESLSFYLSGTNKILYIRYYLLIKNVYEDDQKTFEEKLKKYVQITPYVEDLKDCIEWSIHQGRYELLNLCANRLKEQFSQDILVTIYQLLMDRNINKSNPEDLLDKVEEIRASGVKDKFIDSLLSIVNLYALFDNRNFDAIYLKSKSVLKKINNLKNGYRKTAFLIRVKEMLAISLMKGGETEKSKILVEELIKGIDKLLFPLPLNSILSLLAELNIFEDKNVSVRLIKKAIKMFEELKFEHYEKRRISLHATHDFINIECGLYENLYLDDLSELAHYNAKIGKTTEALQILNKIYDRNGFLTPHQLYYKALSTKNNNDYEIAKKEFYKKGDFFYTQLFE